MIPQYNCITCFTQKLGIDIAKAPPNKAVKENKLTKNKLRVANRPQESNKKFSPVDALRSKIWVAEIERIAAKHIGKDVSIMQVLDLFSFADLHGRNFSDVKKGIDFPSPQAIDKIAAGSTLNRGKFPFGNTKTLYENGPDGFPLWKILEGDSDVCLQVVDDEVKRLVGKTPDESISFEQRVRILFAYRVPADIDALALWKMITKERTKELHHDFNVIALTAMEADNISGQSEHVAVNGNVWTKAESINTVSAGQIMANIALYVLSRQKKDLISQCSYMLTGVLRKAILEQVPHGALIAEFLSRDEWAYQGLS